jgi:hypothetical protein
MDLFAIVCMIILAPAVLLAGWRGWEWGKREGDGQGYARGYQDGYDKYAKELELLHRREMHDAGRSHMEFPDSAGTARISQMRIVDPPA